MSRLVRSNLIGVPPQSRSDSIIWSVRIRFSLLAVRSVCLTGCSVWQGELSTIVAAILMAQVSNRVIALYRYDITGSKVIIRVFRQVDESAITAEAIHPIIHLLEMLAYLNGLVTKALGV